jgi:hypothetical protein
MAWTSAGGGAARRNDLVSYKAFNKRRKIAVSRNLGPLYSRDVIKAVLLSSAVAAQECANDARACCPFLSTSLLDGPSYAISLPQRAAMLDPPLTGPICGTSPSSTIDLAPLDQLSRRNDNPEAYKSWLNHILLNDIGGLTRGVTKTRQACARKEMA